MQGLMLLVSPLLLMVVQLRDTKFNVYTVPAIAQRRITSLQVSVIRCFYVIMGKLKNREFYHRRGCLTGQMEIPRKYEQR